VIGDSIDYGGHAMATEGGKKTLHSSFSTQVATDLSRICNIVTVGAIGGRLEDRGEVDMTDAKLCQIRHDAGGVTQVEP
jgi:hypothetical protein